MRVAAMVGIIRSIVVLVPSRKVVLVVGANARTHSVARLGGAKSLRLRNVESFLVHFDA